MHLENASCGVIYELSWVKKFGDPEQVLSKHSLLRGIKMKFCPQKNKRINFVLFKCSFRRFN